MCSNNLEMFNEASAYLLVKLFEKFPVCVDIDSAWVGANVLFSENERYEEAEHKFELTRDTISWLGEAGFLSYQGFSSEEDKYIGVRLTLKGLTLLGYSLEPTGSGVTFYERIKGVLEAASAEAIKDTLKDLFKVAVATTAGTNL